jgi:hypothetical protein
MGRAPIDIDVSPDPAINHSRPSYPGWIRVPFFVLKTDILFEHLETEEAYPVVNLFSGSLLVFAETFSNLFDVYIVSADSLPAALKPIFMAVIWYLSAGYTGARFHGGPSSPYAAHHWAFITLDGETLWFPKRWIPAMWARYCAAVGVNNTFDTLVYAPLP